eukprot:TRINITY_DN61315_c0_g1_i1.p1 TRINITY_DN61315_c0_g1~~TRINITY_DN61315_c0_g1_i1.p1  ORF type:complete len:229 (+),score=27.18 TRINITY_DN61315_c0_g1_i1:51-737(+)
MPPWCWMGCACLPLQRFSSHGHKRQDDLEVPQTFSARYIRLQRDQPLPQALIEALAIVSPETAPARDCAFVRDQLRFPKHFLHSTLVNQGVLGQAVYYFQTSPNDIVTTVLSCWSLSPQVEGPPNFCHGGCIAALLDDAFGAFTNTYLRSSGRSGEAVTAFLHVDYKKPTQLSALVICVVELDKIEGRKIFAKGRMLSRVSCAELVVVCEASALFIELKQGFAEMTVK